MFISKISEQSFGLDISDLSLKVVQLVKNKNKINIQALGQVNLPKGVIDNGIIKDKEIVLENLKKLINKPKLGFIDTDSVVACLPETKTYIKLIEINKNPNNINDIIQTEIEKNIPISVDDMYYDWQIINKLENQDLVLIGAAPKNIVNSHIDLLKSAGLSISALEVESMAICRSLLTEEGFKTSEESKNNYCIIDIGAKRSSLIIYSKDTIVLSVSIPISGDEATEKIAETLEIKKDQAEKAKIICGLDKTKAQGVVNKILSGMINDLTDKIINKSIGIETILGNPLTHLNPESVEIFKKIEEKHNLKDQAINNSNNSLSTNQSMNLSYTTAVGLALRDIFIADN